MFFFLWLNNSCIKMVTHIHMHKRTHATSWACFIPLIISLLPSVHSPHGHPLWCVECCQAARLSVTPRAAFSTTLSLSLSPSLSHTLVLSHTLYIQSTQSHTFTHTLSLSLSLTHTHTHTHTETPLLPSLHGGNQKVSWLRAGITQMHLIEESTMDRAKTTAALTFHVLTSHPSDFVSQRKLY